MQIAPIQQAPGGGGGCVQEFGTHEPWESQELGHALCNEIVQEPLAAQQEPCDGGCGHRFGEHDAFMIHMLMLVHAPCGASVQDPIMEQHAPWTGGCTQTLG
jgi:hypothetical protein